MRAVGLFDEDGRKQKEEIDAQGADYVRTIGYRNHYPPHLRHISRNGKKILISPALEEMFPPEIWRYAEKQGWTEARGLSLQVPWHKTALEYLKDEGYTDQDCFYIGKKIKRNKKEDLARHVCAMRSKNLEQALAPFEPIIKKICEFLFP